jgi:hypothetical protein
LLRPWMTRGRDVMKAPDEVSAMLRLKALGFFGQIHERENFASQESQGDGWGFHGMRPGDIRAVGTSRR